MNESEKEVVVNFIGENWTAFSQRCCERGLHPDEVYASLEDMECTK